MILLTGDNRIIVQGITGGHGSFHTRLMLEYGTKVVAGVTPNKGGQRFDDYIPIYNTVEDSVRVTGADVSAIFVPPASAADAILEAAAAGIRLIVAITEGIPVLDMIKVRNVLDSEYPGTRLIGPNCPGIITPGQSKVGIMPGYIHKPGNVGVVSRSGTLTYEAVWQLTSRDIGQSTCIGLGGDPVNGTNFIDALTLFAEDPDTHAVVLIGEIGGTAEEEAAVWIKENMPQKPVTAFIAGMTAPKGKRMGHAGAIISGGKGTATEKIATLRENGIAVAESPADIGSTLAQTLTN